MAVTAPAESRRATRPAAQQKRPRRSLSPMATLSSLWRPSSLLLALLIAWWAVTEADLVAPYILPSPADTWQTAVDNAA
ncbi:MAG: hypothetical protein PGN37_14380 [Mycobacterium kyogaense]|uniref:hypothetical protein n=1 Tax=Mycobacterium kyogaense TaxID=2212479 RepID=UPI002FF9F753